MQTFDYFIIGGGMTAASAAQAIRAVDAKGTIGLISAEDHPPYKRPPLTKQLWQGKPEDSVWMKLPKENLELLLGCRITAIDPIKKQVTTADRTQYGYGKLLLATGGRPRRLPFGPESVLYYRKLDDYHTVRGWAGKGKRIGVIGGGFIGSEIAAALATNGERAVMVFPEDGIGASIFPRDLSAFITEYYREKGVEVLTGLEIEAMEPTGEKITLKAKGGQAVEVDEIIAGIGLVPNTKLAEEAGLKLAGREAGGGIEVDEHLRTSQADIYAAGDVASFFHQALGRRMRVEHEDNAVSMGTAAGQNMAGKETVYSHQPFFYSDLFDLGYEAVGELDSRLETFADWVEPFRKGVIYYLKDFHVRGVLLWNTWGQLAPARELVAAERSYTAAQLKGLLPKEPEK